MKTGSQDIRPLDDFIIEPQFVSSGGTRALWGMAGRPRDSLLSSSFHVALQLCSRSNISLMGDVRVGRVELGQIDLPLGVYHVIYLVSQSMIVSTPCPISPLLRRSVLDCTNTLNV